MNNLMIQEVKTSLPLNIAKGLEAALDYLPGGENAKIEKPTSEGLFNHILLITTEFDRCVFRARRDISAEAGDAYMQYMYEATGFIQNGGSFKLRNIAEEADFLKQALADDLPVPKLIYAEQDWMLIEYVTGKTLLEFLEDGEVKFLKNIIQEMNLAHRRGIIYADRWGGNEMIDAEEKVRMIDFDIEWFYQGGNDGTLEALEMAWTIFNGMRITTNREDLLNLVECQIVPSLKAWGYDFYKMQNFIQGLCNFYLDPNKPSNQWSLPKSLYLRMAEPANRLVNMFNS